LHDAAHSFGSKYKGKYIGSFSDMTMFSFDPVKSITCLDGGALIVKTKEEVKMLHEMRLVGMGQPAEVMYQNKRAWTYDMKNLGFRYHMSNMHAAIGLAQLSKITRISNSRRETCKFYNKNFKNISEIVIPKTDFNDITPFLYYIRVKNNLREELKEFLYVNGVDTGIHWQPGHWFSLLKNCKRGNLSVTEDVGREILSLPLHSEMSKEDMKKVVDMIRLFFEGKQ
jgi:dTDP-4-amino-4,6-dideoxygalactose transaminase